MRDCVGTSGAVSSGKASDGIRVAVSEYDSVSASCGAEANAGYDVEAAAVACATEDSCYALYTACESACSANDKARC